MNFRAFKIGIFCAVLAVIWMAAFALETKQVFAYFDDPESSPDNSLIAGALDFYLSSPQDFLPEMTCSTAERTIDLLNNGNPFRYKIETTDFSGDLCNYIILEANLDGGASECQGNLIGFNCEEFLFAEPNGIIPHQWHFTATLIDGFPEESVCSFKFLYSGWQVDLEGGGFHDEEEIENTITSGICAPELPKLVINKVYYDVDSDHGTEPANEWIELYNDSDSPIDIMNWSIEDDAGLDVLSASSVIIPSYGYALITGSATTWNYWEIPADVVKIVLSDGTIGNGLDNTADMLVLRDNNGNIIDQMNWGIPDTNWLNYNLGVWTPMGCPDVDEGHMLGRVPDGKDNNQPSDFQDLAPPVVSVSYYHSGYWYCGRTYTINWTAVNQNGDDNELLIDIVYITDNDRNGRISSGDRTYLAADHIANSGSYSLYIRGSYCYFGYVWVKVIAYGPENFMVQNSVTGPRVFEPPEPDEPLESVGAVEPAESPADIQAGEPVEPTESIEPVEPD
jgi:hypothetical protein